MVSRLAFVVAIAGWVSSASAKPRWEELPLPPAMPPAASKCEVDIGGSKIYYAMYGKGDPVILLHGGLGNADHFSHQVPALADKFQVIVIDSRGQGRSTMSLSKTPLTYSAMASDVIGVMDALNIQKASFVGWSDGGEIALRIAVDHPDRVDRLFVFGANYDAKGSKPRNGARSLTFEAYAVKCKTDFMKMAKNPKTYDRVVDALLPVWRNPAGFTKDDLRGIKAPTMVADGDHDEVIVLDQVQEMSQLIPNAKLKIFQNTSHFALWQDPKTFNDALLEFLTEPARPSP
jgi:pimeloyl-ACP methyl ester carboxylesterase